MANNDLDWLAAQRPQRFADRDAHDRALLALLRHTSARPAGDHLSWLRDSRAWRPRTLALLAGTGVAAVAGAVALSVSGTRSTGPASHAHAGSLRASLQHHAAGSPLIRLADDVGASSNGSGDATLMARTTTLSAQAGQGPETVTVYDLYADNGKYYFSHDEAGLAGQVSGGYTEGGGLFAREVAAAKEAAAGNVKQGAQDMADAPDPTNVVSPNQPSGFWTAVKAKLEMLASHGDKQAAAQLAAGPSAQGTNYDNYAWENSQDALMAGTADPQVRDGVLKILATLPGVTVTQGSSDGQPTLILSSGPKETGLGYTEQLTINAENGQPLSFSGGPTGGAAETTVTYRVARVTLSDIAAGQIPSLP